MELTIDEWLSLHRDKMNADFTNLSAFIFTQSTIWTFSLTTDTLEHLHFLHSYNSALPKIHVSEKLVYCITIRSANWNLFVSDVHDHCTTFCHVFTHATMFCCCCFVLFSLRLPMTISQYLVVRKQTLNLREIFVKVIVCTKSTSNISHILRLLGKITSVTNGIFVGEKCSILAPI